MYVYVYIHSVYLLYVCMHSPCSSLFVHYLPLFFRAQGVSVLPPVLFIEWEE